MGAASRCHSGCFIAFHVFPCDASVVETVEVRDGRAVLVRRGDQALRREAAILRAVAGPGAPELVAVEDDGDGVCLITVVEPPLLLPGPELMSVAAQLAAVLARAHAAGFVHGPLRDEHVQGRPGAVVLGGWHDAGPGEPADDVVELGRFVERHAGGDPALVALAERALAPEPPAMAALASTVALPVPAPAPRRPSLPVVGLAVAAVVAATGLLVGGQGQGQATEPPPLAPTTTTTIAPTTTTTTTPRADVRVVGNVVERNGARWTVGQAGDVVVVADLRCTGDPVPAVLRPATGRVWVFDGWAASGEPEAGRVLATVPGSVDLRVERAGRCDRLSVVDAQGVVTAVG